jgi:hypothetical protein
MARPLVIWTPDEIDRLRARCHQLQADDGNRPFSAREIASLAAWFGKTVAQVKTKIHWLRVAREIPDCWQAGAVVTKAAGQ